MVGCVRLANNFGEKILTLMRAVTHHFYVTNWQRMDWQRMDWQRMVAADGLAADGLAADGLTDG